MKKILMTVLFVTIMMFGMMSVANAMSITPAPGTAWPGDSTYLDVADWQWSGYASDKLDNKGGWDADYTGNPSAADIPHITGIASFTGSQLYYHGEIISPDFTIEDNISFTGPLYMVVKDGNDPVWYLFNISNWNGSDNLVLTNFWPENGNISHITIYGNGYSVPEPMSMLLLGLGLVGLAGVRRMVKK